ncbi:MAG: SAM-dependent methyltransferase [Deltaproteobacteria bacterium]|nr:SAM-dependent methyltransferase [Deltaproteobacteria bacterium]
MPSTRASTTRVLPVILLLASADAVPASGAERAAAAPAETTSEPDCGTDSLLAGLAPVEQREITGDVALVTDGAVGAEGTQWNAPLAVTFSTASASLTYDLGRARTVSALYVQADANDTYQILGSTDGTPGSFQTLATVEDATMRGHGLRDRAIRITPTPLRYLRLAEASGDERFSISELAAYCRLPSPFPPAMKTVEAPRAETRRETPEKTTLPEEPGANRLLLFLAVVLAAFGVGGVLWPRPLPTPAAPPKAAPKSAEKPPPSPEGPATEAAAPPAPAPPAARSHEGVLRLMFLGSGCAALVYEVVWVHLLRLVIGASALSVGIVLASFMGGMFLGSLLFARFVRKHRHPLRVYGALELGIGLFGLLMPLVLPAVRSLYVGLVGYGALGIALRAVVAAALLLPPTALMGATLPAIARRYSTGRRGMSRLAGLYAANTIGAVLGSLLSAFYLLPVWDVWIATFAAVGLNALVGTCALVLGGRIPRHMDGPMIGTAPTAAPALAHTQPALLRVVYAGAALSGFSALGAQVIWTRHLTLLFGATVYAFAIVLAVFLAGLGLGSALSAYLLRRGFGALRSLAWTQLLLVLSLFLGSLVLARLLPFSSLQTFPWTPTGARHWLHVLRAIDVVLPSAVLWGASFPFALAAAGAGHEDTARSSGNVYAANTVGAILGSLGISFWAIPQYGTRWAAQALAISAGISAALLFAAARRRLRRDGVQAPRAFRSLSPTLALAASFAAAAFLPGLSHVFLAHGRYIGWVDPRDEYPYVSEGAASTVAVHIAPDGYRNFHVSGRVEATNNPNDLRTERLIGHLSAVSHRKPESVLVVGLGAGITAGTLALYPEVKRMVICEIEPRVVGAAQLFSKENGGVLSDPRVQMVFDDARHFLATARETFDIITSDPIHPWVRGNSLLFSREYYAIVKSHLRPGGIATQWVPLYETNELAIKIQLRTFMDAFPHGTLWNTVTGGKGFDVVLVGGLEPLRIDLPATERRIHATPRMFDSFKEVRITSVIDLLSAYGASGKDMAGWLAGAPVNRDFSLKLEYISGLALDAREADAIYSHMAADRTFPAETFTGPPEQVDELRRRVLGKSTIVSGAR